MMMIKIMMLVMQHWSRNLLQSKGKHYTSLQKQVVCVKCRGFKLSVPQSCVALISKLITKNLNVCLVCYFTVLWLCYFFI